jgi:pimeloyl-ACP methyl ester carboxylesterase
MSATPTIEFLDFGPENDSRKIAYIERKAAENKAAPTLVWLGGYRSDMSGTKAVELDAFAETIGTGCLRLDYSGHGASGGDFNQGTISRWLSESLAVIHHVGLKNVIIVGSSMGGWIALRAAQELQKQSDIKVSGMVLIAPAPDFTSELIEPALSAEEKHSLETRGYFEELSEYSPEPNIFTRDLIEDGRNNRVLDGIIQANCPVHILQGMKDDDVPYQHALRLLEHLPSDDVTLTLIRDGDHRLSRPQDILRLTQSVSALLQ